MNMVDVDANDAATEHTTWGQRAVWKTMLVNRPNDARFNMHLRIPVPVGISLRDTIAAVRSVVACHESLRTTFDDDAPGPPRQRVHSAGIVEVPVVEDADEDGIATVTALAQRRFDLTTELPVRFAIGVRGGEPRWIACAMARIVTDGAGWNTLLRDLQDSLRGRPLERAYQPREQAQWESSAAGQSQLRRSMQFWDAKIASVPPLFTRSRGGPPNFPSITAYVRGLGCTARNLASSVGVGDAAVFLSALVAALAREFGVSRCAVPVHCSNRTRAPLKRYVGTLAQHGLLAVDVVGDKRLLMRQTASGLLLAGRYSLYDPWTRDDMLREKGHGADVEHFANFVPLPGALNAPSDFAAVGDHDALVVADPPIAFSSMRLAVQFRTDGTDASISLFVDTRYLDRDLMPVLLANMVGFLTDRRTPAQSRLESYTW
ncbi:condensation domain-containing protein [Micromonospora sp. CNB394]|uniref:condensation domain-containing protein n=1 Tax=Micromonospora sp. CNB394 TaxID=1169151 RepID=UPI0009DC2EAF|nr:condensation domain-containing protein [Micromonospora sp. CNB394]